MRILLFDPFNGAAGDMIIGSLLSLGADREGVVFAMASVVQTPSIREVDRCGIRATLVETHAPPNHRTLEEVLGRVDECEAPVAVKKQAVRVFERLHLAEKSVHGEHVHFHEVGADDAIADVVGACTALHSLDPDHVAVGSVSLGRGLSEGSHGLYPLPSPATLAILSAGSLPVILRDEERELCTPTGAALLSEFANLDPAEIGESRVSAVGYGAGSRNPRHTPNVLRASLLVTPGPDHPSDRVDILETNVDDVTGEVLAFTLGRLMDEGARDASAAPLIMKKGRSGYLVRVICDAQDADHLSSIMARELGTLGIRHFSSVHRFKARRTVDNVSITIGGRNFLIDVKIGWRGEEPVSLKPEFDQVRECALATGLSLREVGRMAERAGWSQLKERGPDN